MSSSTTTPTDSGADAELPAISEQQLHAALAAGTRPPRASPLTACAAFGWRCMLKIKHVPEQLLDVTITPVMFLLMFVYLFGGAVSGSTDAYLQFVLPGVLTQAVLFTTVYSGVTINTDMTKGVVDRFRTLPIWPAAPLVGATIGDLARYLIASVVVLALGLILGFEAGGGVLGVLGGVLLLVLFSSGLAWVFTTLGLVMRSQSATMNAGFMALFPLVFLSNIFVDPTTLPAVLEWFVGVNPVSHVVTAVRGLLGGDADAGDIGLVLGEAAVLTAIFVPLTNRLYRGRA
jgi:ABC-2 type transport system permease protein